MEYSVFVNKFNIYNSNLFKFWQLTLNSVCSESDGKFWILGNVEYPFIAITFRSILTRNGSNFSGFING